MSKQRSGLVEGKVCVVSGGARGLGLAAAEALLAEGAKVLITDVDAVAGETEAKRLGANAKRSEEHTSELQSLMRISYAVFCLKKKNKNTQTSEITNQQNQTTS